MTRPGARPGGPSPGRWADLAPRIATGLGLSATGLLAIWLGGVWFAAFVTLAVVVVVWELARMVRAEIPVILSGLAGAACLTVALAPPGWGLPLIMAPVLAGIGRVGRERLAFALFTVMAVLAGIGLIHLRADFDTVWLVWLVLVVVATDVFGYFAGRLIGGPRFWPTVSPKKTWAGTVAGWIGGAGVGLVLVLQGVAGGPVIAMSIALSMASQMGDIAESALKRRVGVKDSSNLLPGHGGFFDRFDGVLGAAVFLLLVEQVVDFPPVAGG